MRSTIVGEFPFRTYQNDKFEGRFREKLFEGRSNDKLSGGSSVTSDTKLGF